MRRKSLALTLTLVLLLSSLPAALGAESITPVPPSWVPEEEYAIFPGSAAYEPENWEIIQQVRAQVAWGDINLGALPLTLRRAYEKIPNWNAETQSYDMGVLFEKALLETRLLYTDNSGNTGPYWTTLSLYLKDPGKDLTGGLTDEQLYAVLLWEARGILRREGLSDTFYERLSALCAYPQFSLQVLADSPVIPEKTRQLLQEAITVTIDGLAVSMDTLPEIRNERTMVPIRAVAEALGATVEWVQESQQVVMTRAGVTVTMTLDSTTAAIDGETVEMDVAPYATNGRTFIPARYVAEFFGQKVDWDGTKRQVLITEDKSVAGDSNLEAWALPMGAMLDRMNAGDPAQFGMYFRGLYKGIVRVGDAASTITLDRALKGWETSREVLADSWSITSREELISTVISMTLYGHDATFREMAADVKLRTPEERDAITAASAVWPAYMWEYTENLDDKWGDRGIMAWDLFRMSNLVQWGYVAGYVTYEEALALLEPAATILCQNFSSWDEAYENYLDGYNWWARNDVLDQDVWQTARGKLYLEMKADPATAHIFDDTLFETGVIGLPEK